MTTRQDDPPQDAPQPLAALLAFLFPGLGHLALGQTRRAALVATGVLGLFLTGLLVAGIDAVDSGAWYITKANNLLGRRQTFAKTDGDPIWFLGQMFCGPFAFGVDYYHQSRLKVLEPQGQSAYLRTAKPNEVRDPATGRPIQVRDDANKQPLEFIDPRTGQKRLSTPADRPPYIKPLARTAEIGTLSCTLAGMLNLIAIIDCAYNRRRRDGEQGGEA
ncbi:MAG: hypothetical protein K2Q09_06225 [Phycisphaerales bacterium]|nr:hypothetical protein [Phycisphaerales bacterium]